MSLDQGGRVGSQRWFSRHMDNSKINCTVPGLCAVHCLLLVDHRLFLNLVEKQK